MPNLRNHMEDKDSNNISSSFREKHVKEEHKYTTSKACIDSRDSEQL